MKTPANPDSTPLWRSPEQLAPSPHEFAPGASEWPDSEGDDGMGRRRFIEIMGSALALGGLAGCSRPPAEHMLPYVRQPEELVPGRPTFYATSLLLHGYARGVLVETHEGRPTKIEGNPDHPASLGSSDLHMQAAILDLYDPDRSKRVRHAGADSSWEAFQASLSSTMPEWGEGAGVRFLFGHTTSPTLYAQMQELAQRYPKARWSQHDPGFNPFSPAPFSDFQKADVILSLDDDFLGSGPAMLPAARAFAARRAAEGKMVRLYVVESAPSLTGAQADHRFAMAPSDFPRLAAQLQQALAGSMPAEAPAWMPALVRDLQANRARCVILVGSHHPKEMQDAVAFLNGSLGNPVFHWRPELLQVPNSSLPELTAEMHRGEIKTLVIFGANPAYTAPADLAFGEALAQVPTVIHHGLYVDETAVRATWHLPATHALESWSDARSALFQDSLLQPMIEPLYAGVSLHQLFALFLRKAARNDYEIVRGYWQHFDSQPDFDARWNASVRSGVLSLDGPGWRNGASFVFPKPAAAAPGTLELLIRPDPHVLDGRFANNAWLQELPKPMTRLVWENAAHLAPETAKSHGLIHGQIAELRYRGRTLRAPIWVLPGLAENCVLIHLGYGRTAAGRVGNGLGFNAYALQTSDAPWGGPGLEIRATPEFHSFSTLQLHGEMEGRELIRHTSLAKAKAQPDFAQSPHDPKPEESLYPQVRTEGHAWGMTIDLSTCLGCNVCTIACQAENNIPTVGREQAMRGRAMHWIRVDRYYSGSAEAPTILHQPVPCMHCENAPCEVVCPVGATVHDHEGLNVMVYNRCVGTRYCSNNCPYKVRRFNFLSYTDSKTPSLKLQRNPHVTVRARGVMEKCTYCTQRINTARIEAENARRPLRDGEITPACAQACPTGAITFGDLHDPQSRVAQQKAEPRNYALLGELNARPRTTYLAKIWNPNPELAP